MLQKLHDRSGSLVIKIILTVIGASFVVFGIADVVRIITATPPVAKIGKHPISFQEFFQTYQKELYRFKQKGINSNQEWVQTLAKDIATKLLIVSTVRTLESERLGLVAPESALRHYITSMPEFQKDGKFNAELYQQYIRYFETNKDALLSKIKANIKNSQLIKSLESNISLNDYYTNLLLDTARERKVFEIVFAPDHFDIEKPTDSDLKSYLKSHSKAYTIPEQRDIEVYWLDYDKLKETLPVTQEELNNEFEERKEEWVSLEQRMVYSFSCSNQADAELVKRLLLKRTKTEDVRKKIPGIQVNTIGMINKGALPQEISDSVFALNAGESFGPVRSGDEYLVYLVTEVKPAVSKSMDDQEVKKALEEGVKNKKLSVKLEEIKNLIEDDFAAGKTDDICQKFPMLAKKTINDLSQNNHPEKLKEIGVEESSLAAIQDVVFSLDEKGDSQFIDISNASIIIRVTQIKKQHVPELETIKEKVLKDWTSFNMKKTAENWCFEHFYNVADNDEGWKQAIQKNKCKTEEFSVSIMDLADNNSEKYKKFNYDSISRMMLMPKKMVQTYRTEDGKIVVVRLKRIENILNCQAEKVIMENKIKENIMNGLNNDLFELTSMNIRDSYKVKINQKSIDKIQNRFTEES